jgi:hypothetical protein
LDRFAIPFDELALIVITTKRRVLPSNLAQFNRFHARLALNGKKCIGSLNRSMLASVAGEHHTRLPRLPILCQPE